MGRGAREERAGEVREREVHEGEEDEESEVRAEEAVLRVGDVLWGTTTGKCKCERGGECATGCRPGGTREGERRTTRQPKSQPSLRRGPYLAYWRVVAVLVVVAGSGRCTKTGRGGEEGRNGWLRGRRRGPWRGRRGQRRHSTGGTLWTSSEVSGPTG